MCDEGIVVFFSVFSDEAADEVVDLCDAFGVFLLSCSFEVEENFAGCFWKGKKTFVEEDGLFCLECLCVLDEFDGCMFSDAFDF